MSSKNIQLRLLIVNPTLNKWKLQYRITPTQLKWYRKIFNKWNDILYDSTRSDNARILYVGDNPEEFLEKAKNLLKTTDDLVNWDLISKIIPNYIKRKVIY